MVEYQYTLEIKIQRPEYLKLKNCKR